MMQEYKDRIEKAKKKPYLPLEMYQIGDIVYPFFAHNLVNWGTVVDINPATRKITVNFNGINRQFDPEWLIKTNPQIKTSKINKHKVAFKYHRMVQALYYKQAPGIYKMSGEQEQSGEMRCPKCGQIMEMKFDPQTKEARLVCTGCGRKITRSKVAAMKKVAGKIKQLAMSFQEFARKIPNKEIKKKDIQREYLKYFGEYRDVIHGFLDDLIEVLQRKNVKIL